MNQNIELPVSEWLGQLMRDAGITGYELSRKTGVEASQIQRILSGETKRPIWRTIEPLARFFGENVQIRDGVIRREIISGSAPIIITDPNEIELIKVYRSATKEGQDFLRLAVRGTKQNYTSVAKKTGSK